MENPYIILDSLISMKENIINDIGSKASGLSQVESNLVPRFIVLKSSLYNLWKSGNKKEAVTILEDYSHNFSKIFTSNKVIIRSSASEENFDQRGHYESSSKKIEIIDIVSEAEVIWSLNEPMIDSVAEENFALIIQEYIEPTLYGHLSNERRLSKDRNRWVYEILKPTEIFIENKRVNIKRNEVFSIKCNSKSELIKSLRGIASKHYDERCHFEWVWDNKRVWIVQKDLETINENNYTPGIDWKQPEPITNEENQSFTVLKIINDYKSKWKKAECVAIFKKIGLPYGNVFIIEGIKNLKALNKGDFQAIKNDLNWLLKSPVVVRIDISTSNKHEFLLPRTETLFTVVDVQNFIQSNIDYLINQGLNYSEFCFLIHRFIVSKSCSLAFSKPDIPRTRIDSTWGIVDGLYYHPHDSFEYNSTTETIKEKIRCKTEFLDVDKNGNWIPRKCNTKLDWNKSLSKNEIKTISNYNEKVASYLGRPVTVMYFVGVFKETGYPEILPWYFTTEEIPESSDKFSEVIFAEKKIIINTKDDFNKIKKQINNLQQKTKVSLKLNLIPSLLRDREFLEEIGVFSTDNQTPIILEGSILSHPYYILKKKGAIVKAKGLFEPEYDKQEFYKLVRDKIPIQIESKGESVKSLNITPKQYLELIKQKLIEEAYECFWEEVSDNIVEELADIYELLRAASKIFEINIKEVEKIADKKKKNKGGFEEGVFLIETKEEALIKTIEHNEKYKNLELDGESSVKGIDSSIPKFNRSSFNNNVLFIPFIPSLINSETRKRTEKIGIDAKKHFSIKFKEKGVEVEIESSSSAMDLNQLSLPLSYD